MSTYLLDANVLIALTVAEHDQHDDASAWVAGVDKFALCPVVEGALIRFLVRIGESAAAAVEVLHAVHALPRCEFWGDSVSHVDARLGHVRGHRQVTDAYLATLADAGGGKLATFDKALATELPDSIELLPSSS